MASTALQFLNAATKPVFKVNHTLLPLTRWAWPLSYDLNVAMATDWGYALDISLEGTGSTFDNPSNTIRRLADLAAANPGVYKVSSNVYRVLTDATFKAACPEATWCHDEFDVRLQASGVDVFSPIGPSSVYDDAADAAATLISKIVAVCPVDIILHGGEDGMQVPGNSAGAFEADPDVMAELLELGAESDETWDEFLSNAKATQVIPTRNACVAATGDENCPFIYYVTGDQREGISDSHWYWAWDHTWMKDTSTHTSFQSYFYYDGLWLWGGNINSPDLLSMVLDGTAQGIDEGNPLTYQWVSAGWSGLYPERVSPDDTYMGFLKCLYAAGSVGAVSGYFRYMDFSNGTWATAPDWVRQIMILSHVHAAFSHLEDFLYDGDLLVGDGNHVYLTDLPSYEFDTDDSGTRVLVRKRTSTNEWLICAWAADGEDRNVTVTVPTLGEITVEARAVGSLYYAKNSDPLVLLDEDVDYPSIGLSARYLGAENTPPVADDATVDAVYNIAKTITLRGTDEDDDILTYYIVDSPTYGSVSLVGNVATYTQTGDYQEVDTFTFRVYDGAAYSDPATITINVIPEAPKRIRSGKESLRFTLGPKVR